MDSTVVSYEKNADFFQEQMEGFHAFLLSHRKSTFFSTMVESGLNSKQTSPSFALIVKETTRKVLKLELMWRYGQTWYFFHDFSYVMTSPILDFIFDDWLFSDARMVWLASGSILHRRHNILRVDFLHTRTAVRCSHFSFLWGFPSHGLEFGNFLDDSSYVHWKWM